MKKVIKILIFCLLIIALTGCGKKSEETSTTDINQNKETTPSPTESQAIENEPKENQLPTITPYVDATEEALYPIYVLENGVRKYGYIDKDGEIVIKPIYDSATDFSYGHAVVLNNETYQLINTKGDVIYESPFDIKPFQNGAAIVSKLDGSQLLYGYIDKTGKEIAGGNFYEYADYFNSDNKAYVYNKGICSIIDKSGKVLESYTIDPKYEFIYDFRDGYILYVDVDTTSYGVINCKGEEILEPSSDPFINEYLGNDIFELKKYDDETFIPPIFGPSALINSEGIQITDFTLYDLTKYHDGYASTTDDKYTYFIDTFGKEVTTLPKVEGRGDLTLLGDLVKANIDNKLFYMKKDGTILWESNNEYRLTPQITVKQEKFKPNKYVTVYYPVFEGLTSEEVQTQINNQLFEIFVVPREALTKEDQLSVEDFFTVQLKRHLLEIYQTGYDYSFGAAHGMPIQNYYYINVDTGEFYQLKDLFKKDSDYINVINQILKGMIEEEAKNEDSMIYSADFETIQVDQTFYLTNDGVVIYFYPYEISAYAAGFPEFLIPYEELSDIIDDQGMFWKAFH